MLRIRMLPLLGLWSVALAAASLSPGQDTKTPGNSTLNVDRIEPKPAATAGGGTASQQKGTSPSPNSTVFQETRARAETGDAPAQAELGRMHEKGLGIAQDCAEAVKWYRKAAEQGWPSAECGLAGCYRHGRGVPQDYAAAAKWCRKAAEQGVASAQFDLGFSYYNGHGVPQDFAEGLKWYRKAAEQGFALAQYNLGLRYGFGIGVPRDYVQAYKWFNLAAAQNVTHAIHDRNDVSDSIPEPNASYILLTTLMRNEVFNSMTRSQIAEGRQLCHEFTARKEGGTPKQADSPILVSSAALHIW